MSSEHPEKEPQYSEETKNFTKLVKEQAKSYSPWEDAGADLVGILPVERLDSIQKYRIDWMGEHTTRPREQMEDAKSLIVLGYHASDDIYEAILRKDGRIEPYYFLQSGVNQRRVIRFLQRHGYEARSAVDTLPKKQMARLAGLGNYGKNALIINPKYGPWIRLSAIITDAEFVYDDPFTEDLCGDCDECVKACPTGALTPYKVDPERCLVNPVADEYIGLISGDSKYSDKHGGTPDIDEIYEAHSPRFTENSILMCTTCQRACPYGREERGLTSTYS
jgi:epoxyqueuosine reductase QueG